LVAVSSGASSYITAKLINPQIDNSTNTTQLINVDNNNNVVSVVEKISESVVSISTRTTSYGWFGQRIVSDGAGTGIVISEDGYILTNNHVIEGSSSVSISTHNEIEYAAEIIATDASKDLALIKVKTKVDLTAAKIGDSDLVQVGEEVIAVGNVLGRYRNSVTKGIVSGLGRPIVTEGSSLYGDLHELDDLIQTDTAINSGNSGGPLVNMKGEVIGINTAIDGSAQNIGFSVPINHAKELVSSIKND
jgi:serine protease Do